MGSSLKQRYGHWALVTGAGRGLGAEFSRQLAAQGMNVILVDVLADEVNEMAITIQNTCKVKTKAIVADLSLLDFLPALLQDIGDIDVGFLVNNAGVSSITKFLDQSEEQLRNQLSVNCHAVLMLTRHYARQMKERGKGGVIIVSSGAAELPSAYNASYSATKAYELRLAESLWYELKPYGVDVLGFMPAVTDTPGIQQQGYKSSQKSMGVEPTVKDALHFVGKRPSVIAGAKNRVLHNILLALATKKQRIALVSSQIEKMFF